MKESGHARTVERLAADRAGAQDQTDQIGHAFLPARPRGAGPRHRRILCRCRRALCRRRNFPNRSLPGRRHRVVSLDRDELRTVSGLRRRRRPVANRRHRFCGAGGQQAQTPGAAFSEPDQPIACRHQGQSRQPRSDRGSGPVIEQVSVRSLKPYPRNARRHSKDQIKQIAASITRFGFNNPILIADDGEIVAGHGRLAAAKLLGLETVPTLRLSHLNEAERRAYVITDNKLALNAGWDREMLAIEFQGLVDLDFEIELTGFSLAEVDIVLDEARESGPDGADASVEDTIPPYQQDAPAVSQMGDFWLLDRHKLICGDARDSGAYDLLMGDDVVDLICTDPPYNVPIDGHVCGSGRIRHRNFAMGAGEMNKDQFTRFLVGTLGGAAARCRDG